MPRSWLERFRARRWQPETDALLIAYADRLARLYEKTPGLCEACQAFGPVDALTVAYRPDGPRDRANLIAVCRGCAGERELASLPVLEGAQIASADKPIERVPVAVLEVERVDSRPTDEEPYRYVSPRRVSRRATV